MKYLYLLVIGIIYTVTPHILLAQSVQSLSVTPPLFQLSVKPGDFWQSNLKVVNNNSYALTVFPKLTVFEPHGEYGQGTFHTPTEDENTLASWIKLDTKAYIIDPGSSITIPFSVTIPEDAPPGGHYAAVQVSTEPPAKPSESQSVVTSQAVTSLIFVRIAGEIVESGTIRTFRVQKRLVDTPTTEISLRFENKGNVHLRPHGSIVIRNMWGKEVGSIPVNKQSHYGNVLPASVREFDLAWSMPFSVISIGRYKAEAILVYGEDTITHAGATTYFYVLPVKGTILTLVTIGLLVYALVTLVRRYIRKILRDAGVAVTETSEVITKDTTSRIKSVYERPLKNTATVIDLRKNIVSKDIITTLKNWLVKNKKLLLLTLLATLVIVIAL